MAHIRFLLSIFIIVFNINLLNAEIQDIPMMEKDGSISLPSQKSSNLNLTTGPLELKTQWFKFNNLNPSWKVFFNAVTGKPHRAFGKPIPINGFSNINSDNVQNAALAFIEQNKDLFGIDINNLKVRKSIKVNNLWTLSFAQMYNGVEVLLTELELRIRQDAKVIAFGIDFYDNINIDIKPAINMSQAETIAYNGLIIDNKKDKIQSNSPFYILPVKNGTNVSFGLVKEFIVDMNSTNKKFASFVDMHSGNILWRRNLIANVETPITVKGHVKLKSRLSNFTEESFSNFSLFVNGQNIFTDSDGKAMIDINSLSFIEANIEGKWAAITYDEIAPAHVLATLNPGEPFTINWKEGNSHRFERSLYYHTNYAHEFYNMIDPDSRAMDFQLIVTILNYGQPNAASELENGNIYFFGANSPSMYLVETPSVLYHEYGHSINTRLYKELGISQGMINKSCHEAMADLNAGLMTDQPKVGYLAFPDSNETIRNIDNTNFYPTDIIDEAHNDGLILGGTFWDLRKLTNLDYVRWLVHYTKKMGTPDDENTGLAFFEWFIETLITDDNYDGGDNDLSNGTPHASQIIQSFNKHGIGTNLAMQLSFEHTPYEDTHDTENPYKIQFKVRNPITFLNYQPKNIKLHYTRDGQKNTTEINATLIGNDTYEAYIPAMPKGTIVNYYMSAYDEQSVSNIYFYQDQFKLKSFQFLVGYNVGITMDFENSEGWTIGSTGDGAKGGKWEIGIPKLVSMNLGNGNKIIQPGSDHSEQGTKCLVTGASNGGGTQQGIIANMPDGKTTVTSPPFDLTTTEKPVFSYYRFFSNIPYIGINPSTFRVFVSGSDGDYWTQVELTSEPSNGWEKVLFPIESYVSKSNRFKVRFEFTGYRFQGYPTYLSEGLVDDIEILTANDNSYITEVNEADFLNEDSMITLFPNPFSEYIEIHALPSLALSEVSIYDILGIKIKTLHSDSGSIFRWDGKNFQNEPVPNGIYFVKISNGFKTFTKKIILH